MTPDSLLGDFVIGSESRSMTALPAFLPNLCSPNTNFDTNQAQLVYGLAGKIMKEASTDFTTEAEANRNRNCLYELQRIKRIYVERETNLYLKEAALPPMTLAPLYSYIRADPRWYLGKWVVSECAARGGCCGRDCGCCAKRLFHKPRRSMSGHRSLACPCCERRRGGAIDPDRVALIDQRYKEALDSDNPAFLACIASNYFAPGSPPGGDPAREIIPVETELGGPYSAEWAGSPPPYEAYDSGAIKCEDSLSSPGPVSSRSSSASET